MLATLKRYPSSINLLLGASMVLTLARAITLPYLVIYLSGHFSLSVADIGLAIGSTLIIGSLLMAITAAAQLVGFWRDKGLVFSGGESPL